MSARSTRNGTSIALPIARRRRTWIGNPSRQPLSRGCSMRRRDLESPRARSVLGTRMARARILAVELDEAASQTVCEALRREGYLVEAAATGEETLQKAR